MGEARREGERGGAEAAAAAAAAGEVTSSSSNHCSVAREEKFWRAFRRRSIFFRDRGRSPGRGTACCLRSKTHRQTQSLRPRARFNCESTTGPFPPRNSSVRGTRKGSVTSPLLLLLLLRCALSCSRTVTHSRSWNGVRVRVTGHALATRRRSGGVREARTESKPLRGSYYLRAR